MLPPASFDYLGESGGLSENACPPKMPPAAEIAMQPEASCDRAKFSSQAKTAKYEPRL